MGLLVSAIHEAGHAVMCVYFQHPLSAVDIVNQPFGEKSLRHLNRDGQQGGQVKVGHKSYPAYRRIKGMFYCVDRDAVRRRHYEDLILILVAGAAAEKLCNVPEEQADLSGTADRVLVEKYGRKIGISKREMPVLLHSFENRAMKILGACDVYSAMMYIAADLEQYGQLSKAQVLDCCKGMKRRRTSLAVAGKATC